MNVNHNLFGLEINAPHREHSGKFMAVAKDPQKDVKIHLEAALSITVLECIRLYKTTELRRIISRLRKSGMLITDSWYVENGKRKYKIYRLSKT